MDERRGEVTSRPFSMSWASKMSIRASRELGSATFLVRAVRAVDRVWWMRCMRISSMESSSPTFSHLSWSTKSGVRWGGRPVYRLVLRDGQRGGPHRQGRPGGGHVRGGHAYLSQTALQYTQSRARNDSSSSLRPEGARAKSSRFPVVCKPFWTASCMMMPENMMDGSL